uniref:Microfibril associated protein 2 n=1 Tax=Amphilophus citrinellus TaxID=61819 RepID=A0A3Q0SIG9_AMPCI
RRQGFWRALILLRVVAGGRDWSGRGGDFRCGVVQCGAAKSSRTHRTHENCREEQYPCTRLYSVHKPCKQCLNSLCFYSLRRVYIINKEICVRTVCAHEEETTCPDTAAFSISSTTLSYFARLPPSSLPLTPSVHPITPV